MAGDDSGSYPSVTPYLLYEDVGEALAWLGRAFGFEEGVRVPAEDGTILHAEMRAGDGLIMLGHPGPDYRNPRRTGLTSVLVHVVVDDADAHYARAREAGAEIVREPQDEDYGDRRYDVKDPEGHLWSFAHHVRDVPSEEWGAQTPDR